MKRIKEYLSQSFRKSEQDENMDKLSQIVFKAEKESLEESFQYYISSSNIHSRIKWDQIKDQLGDEIAQKFGDFEFRVIDKLLYPSKKSPIICIVGSVGAGKTMLMSLLQYSYKNMDGNEFCHPQKGLISYIDLNAVAKLDETNKHKLYEIFTDHIISAMQKEYEKFIGSTQQELLQFWPYLLNNDSTPIVKGRLIKCLRVVSLPTSRIVLENIEKLNEAYKLLCSDAEVYFQYNLLLWAYLKELGEQGQCALIIIDNIDWQPPQIQEEIVSNILPYSHIAKTPFLVAARPTFYLHNRIGARLLDIEDIGNPTPSKVIDDCFNKFNSDPEYFFDIAKISNITERQKIIIDIGKLYQLYNRGNTVKSFVNNLFGSNKRAALACFHSAFKHTNDPNKNEEGLSPHQINRLVVRRGEAYFNGTLNTDIDNIFSHSNESGNYICKIRVLNYIQSERREFVDLRDLVKHLKQFNFSSNVIKQSLNQLLEPHRQLILSEKYNFFTREAIENTIEDRISITKMGSGYINDMIYNCDYVSEVIMDCEVEVMSFKLCKN